MSTIPSVASVDALCGASTRQERLRRIAVDETSARRGQRYVTPNVLDAENSRLLLMVEGRSAEALRAFAKALVKHGGERPRSEPE
jgi:hypothetical protein